jgi:hypothetical protein
MTQKQETELRQIALKSAIDSSYLIEPTDAVKSAKHAKNIVHAAETFFTFLTGRD